MSLCTDLKKALVGTNVKIPDAGFFHQSLLQFLPQVLVHFLKIEYLQPLNYSLISVFATVF